MKLATTARGFAFIGFLDRYDAPCCIQKSSLATEDAIWLGIVDAAPQIMASEAAAAGVITNQATGWVPYPVPDNVLLTTRMHLTQGMAAELIEVLQHFVDTGDLP